jgi:hypothetical protein
MTGTKDAPIVIGAYGDGPAPILHGMGSVDIALQITDHKFYTVEGLAFRNYTRCGPYFGATGNDDTLERSCTVRGCEIFNISGSANGTGIQGWGTDFSIVNCRIQKIAADGIWLRGARASICYNDVRECSYAGLGLGDCIQIDNCDTGLRVIGNVIDHTNNGDKQAMLIRQEGGGASQALILGNIIRAATMTGSGVVTVQGALDVNFIGNWFAIENNAAIFYLKEGSRLAQGTVMGNVFVGNGTQGRAVSSNDTAGVISAYCNTVHGTDQGFILGSQGIAANNICHTQARAAIQAGALKKNNCIYNNASSGGMTYDKTHVLTDPMLNADYTLDPSSPCIGAGLFMSSAKHWAGAGMRLGAPDIGAMRYTD